MQKQLSYTDFFFCYSKRLREFLNDKGIRYVLTAKHNHTLQQFYLYLITDELQKALQEYEIRKVMRRMKQDNEAEVQEPEGGEATCENENK